MVWASELGGAASVFIAAYTLFSPALNRLYGWLLGPAPTSPVAVDQAGDDLAGALGRQWAEEDRLRRVNDPRPLPVRFEVTPAALAAMPGVPGSSGDDAASVPPGELAGQFDDVLAVFERVPSRRLVILGAAGAGKSVLVMKLARELLAARRTGMPVPVIVSASTWDPDTDMFEWIAGQLTSNHPGLAREVRGATGEVTTLVRALAAGGILPVIDGFDELPQPLRAKAIAVINAQGSDIPLVVTSRPDEYLNAVTAAGRAISRAMVVELLPLRVPEVKAYLAEATAAAPAGRWQSVFRQMDAEPGGPLARVLATPLMLWLARTVYERSDRDPGELIDMHRFSDPETIENHLLDAFVPAAYASGGRSRFRCTPKRAQRWLMFLAAYLNRTRSPDLAWWRLARAWHRARPIAAGLRMMLSIPIAWCLAVWVLWSHGDWRHGAYFPHESLENLLLGGPVGRLIQHTEGKILSAKSVHQFFSLVASFFSLGSLPQLVIALTLIVVLLSFVATFGKDPPIKPRAVKVRFLSVVSRAFWSTLLYLAIGAFVVVAIVTNTESSQADPFTAANIQLFKPEWLFFALLGFAASFRSVWATVDVARAVSPAEVLRLDRLAATVPRALASIATAAVVWLYFGPDIALAYGIYAAARILILNGVGSGANNYASQELAAARIPMTISRRMPWRAMGFLADAHQHGVLRQDGAVYQFRHIRLQQRLAAQRPRWSARWKPLTEPTLPVPAS